MDKKDIEMLTVEGLKDKLGELKLARSGNKSELQARLLQHFGHSSSTDDESDYGEATPMVNFFTLRDIQDSVSKFCGDKLPRVEHWLREFVDCACTVTQIHIWETVVDGCS